MSIEVVAAAQLKFGVRFVKIAPDEYRSIDGCPRCGTSGPNTDRFKLFLSPYGKSNGPRVWCRRCGFMSYLDDDKRVTAEDVAILRAETVRRREVEREKQLKILGSLRHSNIHLTYFNNLLDDERAIAYDYWASEGIAFDTIKKLKLGYCRNCPTAPGHESFTLPVLYNGELWNVRHRLRNPNGSGKYRPEMPGLPSILWNADDLNAGADEILVMEGEKKQIVTKQETGLISVATMGDRAFLPQWAKYFNKFRKVYVCQDPGSERHARRIAKLIGGNAVVMNLPVKADDFFVKYGGTSEQFREYMALAV